MTGFVVQGHKWACKANIFKINSVWSMSPIRAVFSPVCISDCLSGCVCTDAAPYIPAAPRDATVCRAEPQSMHQLSSAAPPSDAVLSSSSSSSPMAQPSAGLLSRSSSAERLLEPGAAGADDYHDSDSTRRTRAVENQYSFYWRWETRDKSFNCYSTLQADHTDVWMLSFVLWDLTMFSTDTCFWKKSLLLTKAAFMWSKMQ